MEKEEGVGAKAKEAEAFREKLLSPVHGGTHRDGNRIRTEKATSNELRPDRPPWWRD